MNYTEENESYKIIQREQEDKFMGKHFFDYEDGNFAHTISDNMAIDPDGDIPMRMGDNMAMDIDTGEVHFISGWSDDED